MAYNSLAILESGRSPLTETLSSFWSSLEFYKLTSNNIAFCLYSKENQERRRQFRFQKCSWRIRSYIKYSSGEHPWILKRKKELQVEENFFEKDGMQSIVHPLFDGQGDLNNPTEQTICLLPFSDYPIPLFKFIVRSELAFAPLKVFLHLV